MIGSGNKIVDHHNYYHYGYDGDNTNKKYVSFTLL